MVAIEQVSDAVLHGLAESFPERRLLGAWLFGSRADGRGRADSDTDIAVLFDEPLDPVEVFDASGRLATRLGTAVDLVDLRKAGGLVRVEATQRGRPLMPPTTEADFFVTHALSDHAAFAANRQAASVAMRENFHAR